MKINTCRGKDIITVLWAPKKYKAVTLQHATNDAAGDRDVNNGLYPDNNIWKPENSIWKVDYDLVNDIAITYSMEE